MIGLIPRWLQYLRPNFHPWQHDNSALLARYEAMFASVPRVPVGKGAAA
jgi:predicted metal-dependent hydrolase